MIRSAHWRVGGLVLVAVLLAGCDIPGGGSPSSNGTAGSGSSSAAGGSPSSKAPRACTILTPNVAQPVIGADAAQSRDAQPNPKATQCQYKSATGSIDLLVGDWTVIKGVAATTPVSGIGDEASISPAGLNVRKGNQGFRVLVVLAFGSFTGPDADALQARQDAAEKDLAPKLLAKI